MATRAYHNLTSRYNGYFYAKESMKEGLDKLYKNHVDHFERIIPVFNYTDLKESQSLTAEMDKTYKKASSVIERHSIFLKGEEHCNWIDDSYLLIGKSHFYRHNYIDALEVFDFMQFQYKKLPSHYEAMLWSFRCQNEVGTSVIAEEIMDQIRYDKKFPTRLLGEFYAICADFYCKKDDYTYAIENLTKAIPLTKSKRDKTRYTFVLGQLYQKQGQLKKASQYFTQVIKMNPPYEMAFSAKMNEARCFDVSTGNTADLKKRLKKMLRDDKNIEFQDQIYYALAEIADKEKQREQAMEYLHTSIQKSTSNTYQKALSSLKLGDIYLQIPDFKGAQAYYDTAVGLINPQFPDYDDIVTKSKSLNGLVKDMLTIEREDSLQGIAKLDESTRSKLLEKLEADAKAAAIAKKEKEAEEKENQEKLQSLPQSLTTGGGPGGGMGFPGGTGEKGWYFYNQQTLSFGFTEFQKKWGNRKLEDNWRRSNKQQQALTDDFGNSTSQTSDSAAADGKTESGKDGLVYRDKASMLKDIPLTSDAIKKSNDTIVNAFYDMASIYRDQLFFNDKSILAYEELLRRFPENRYKLSCYFQLFQAYTQAEDEPNALKYKNILLNDYPNSDYALLIKDPNYGKNKAFSKSEATKYYEQTYDLFLAQNYSQVLVNCATADTLFPNSKYKPKYDFLKAQCIGKTGTLDEYIKALRLVVAKYPKEDVKVRAANMVEVLLKLQAAQKPAEVKLPADTTKKQQATPYSFNAESEHFFVVLYPKAGVNMAQQKADISDFNDENFGSLQLNISDLIFSNELQMVSVKSFPNKVKAMEYLGVVKANTTLFKGVPELEKLKVLVISIENYPLLYKNKDVAAYEAFFNQKYVQ
ncbi:MAG: tetratricopeptide repeat protein [Bacteroidetes bacterium]|nr:tetratricopeptide repeat protein [Bacteroidota bacterium]